jgi:hypothetical protein
MFRACVGHLARVSVSYCRLRKALGLGNLARLLSHWRIRRAQTKCVRPNACALPGYETQSLANPHLPPSHEQHGLGRPLIGKPETSGERGERNRTAAMREALGWRRRPNFDMLASRAGRSLISANPVDYPGLELACRRNTQLQNFAKHALAQIVRTCSSITMRTSLSLIVGLGLVLVLAHCGGKTQGTDTAGGGGFP